MAVPFARDEAERGGEGLIIEGEQREKLVALVDRQLRQKLAIIFVLAQFPHLPPLLQNPTRAVASLQANRQVAISRWNQKIIN